MNLFQRLIRRRSGAGSSPVSPAILSDAKARGRCLGCAHFVNNPRLLESLFVGLSSLSSGMASVRADDGLCEFHGCYLSAWSSCAGFSDVHELRKT